MLTPDQERAALAEGSVAVVAGAGTGKTHMLAYRYLHHLRQGLSPLGIVAVTFTERAADELRARIRREVAAATDLPDHTRLVAELEAAQISTVHALAARICRDHPERAGVPAAFEIQDELEGVLDQAERLETTLAALPPEVYDVLPYTQLKAVIVEMLRDPLRAGHALAHAPERWPELVARARQEATERLTSQETWQDACDAVRAYSGTAGDVLEEARKTAEAGIASLAAGDLEGAVELLSTMKTGKVGKPGNWPGGGLDEVREALRALKTCLKPTRAYDKRELGLLTLALGPVDDELENVLSVLRSSFTAVYEALKQTRLERRQLDFADLEVHALHALEYPEVRAHYRSRWRAVLVDEFQDTNPVQAEILAKLSEAATLTVVGDEKQSIYGFRGAEAAIFRSVRNQIIAAGGSEVVLAESFRTHAELLEPINGCFAPIFGEAYSTLTPYRKAPPNDGPHFEAFAITLREGEKAARRLCLVHEARELATRIKTLVDDETPIYDPRTQSTRPLGPGDVAVLTRTWRTLDVFNEIFPAVGLPVVHTGGGNLLDTREAKDSMVLLQVLAEPEDDLSLVALLRSPYFAVSDPALYKLKQQKDKGELWWDVLGRSEDEAARRAATILRRLYEASQHHRATRLLQIADRATGYTAVISNLPGAERRLADYRGFVALVRKLEGGLGDVFSVSRRLRRLHLAEAKVERPKLQGLDAVSLMTLHAAKGLEWPFVVVADLDYDNKGGKTAVLVDSELGVALKLGDEEGLLQTPALYKLLEQQNKRREEEELSRLMYVGLTRSRDRLLLSTSGVKGAAYKLLVPGAEAVEVAFAEIVYKPSLTVYPSTAVPSKIIGAKRLQVIAD